LSNVLLIAIGNVMRGDDGAAHHVVQRLEARPGVGVRRELQLTPEIAVDVAGAHTVVFIDADVDAEEASLEPLEAGAGAGTPLMHTITPREIVMLAEKLYGFAGRAYLCRLPVADFDGDGLSPAAEEGVEGALLLLREFFTR
jgi:hydrogenase maturation protease